MFRLRVFTAMLALAFAASGARADTLDYDCDTPAEHFSQLKLVQPGPNHVVSGTLAMKRAYESARIAPSAQISLGPADGGWAARITILGRRDNPELLQAELSVRRAGGEEKLPLGAFPARESAFFLMLISPDGSGVARFGGQIAPFQVPPPTTAIASVSCSTGEFLFTGLDLGG